MSQTIVITGRSSGFGYDPARTLARRGDRVWAMMRVAVPFVGVCHASKWAVEGYSQALRGELASSGVDVLIIEPGPFTSALFPSSPQPEDVEGRSATYPAAVHEANTVVGAAFEGLFADPDTPTGPALVVDAMGMTAFTTLTVPDGP